MFDENVGIIPEEFDKIIDRYREAYNTEFNKNLSEREFKNSNLWKFFSVDAQQQLRAQTETSILFDYFAQYINNLNTTIILQPKTTLYALVEDLEESLGYKVGIRWNNEDNAGQLAIYLDTKGVETEDGTDLSQEDKDKISEIIQKRAVTGYHYIGNIEWTTNLVNGQKWYIRVNLVKDIPISVRCTFQVKTNNVAPSEDELKEMILKNFEDNIKIGMACELTRVVNYENCPWASLIKLEQTTEIDPTGVNILPYQDRVLTCNYDERFKLTEDNLKIAML